MVISAGAFATITPMRGKLNLSGRFRAPAASVAAAVLAVFLAGCEGPAVNITQVRVFTAPAPVGADALIERHQLAGASVGYVLYDLDSGDKLAARNENRRFIPASTAKIPTTVAALHILGPDYRFETRLLTTGSIAEGELEGDLYLQGGGDPLLQAQDLMGLAGRLKDVGVSKIQGRFHYDTTFLESAAVIQRYQPDDAGYNPGLGGLSLDFNQTLVTWRPGGSPGMPPGMTEAFETPAFDEAGPGLSPTDPGPGQSVVYAGPDKISRWLLSPGAAAEDSVFLPVKRPGLRTARVFRRLSGMIGVDLPEPTPKAVPADARTLARVRSQPLIDIVRLALEHSNNMVTELIGQVAVRRLTGTPPAADDSSHLLTRWLKDRLPDTRWDGYVMPNHSGLAANARVTPEQMTAIVRFAVSGRYGGWGYPSLLPVSGLRDAMGGRLRDPVTALRVWAKTGTLKYGKGLAGILFSRQGRRVAFAVYVTDSEKRRHYDADPNPRAPGTLASAEDWIRRAEALEEDLVREWILGF